MMIFPITNKAIAIRTHGELRNLCHKIMFYIIKIGSTKERKKTELKSFVEREEVHTWAPVLAEISSA